MSEFIIWMFVRIKVVLMDYLKATLERFQLYIVLTPEPLMTGETTSWSMGAQTIPIWIHLLKVTHLCL